MQRYFQVPLSDRRINKGAVTSFSMSSILFLQAGYLFCGIFYVLNPDAREFS